MGDEPVTRSAGLGERHVSDDPACVLAAYGLGSCVGLVMWGHRGGTRVMGLAHVVLPASRGQAGEPPAKFADTAVGDLVAALVGAGCPATRLTAVIAGGAAMFARGPQGGADIGAANAARLRLELERAGVVLAAAEIGGHRGRTLRAFVACGLVLARTVGAQEVVLHEGDADGAAVAGGRSRVAG